MFNMCYYGEKCYAGTKCLRGHTEQDKQIFAAKQAAKYKYTRPCFKGTRCDDDTCTHAHNKEDMIAALKRVGHVHEIPGRCKQFDDNEAAMDHVDKMISDTASIEKHIEEHFDHMIKKAVEDEDEFDAFVEENNMHMERASTPPKAESSWDDLIKVAPGAPKKACNVIQYIKDHKGRELFPADE